MEYPESIKDFLSGKMTEENFMKKHDDNKWPEIRMLVTDPLMFSKCLLKLRDPGNRRNVLMQSLPIKRDELERLLESGSSLVTDLKRSSTRQIRPVAIAKFGIIYRVPFSWGNRAHPGDGFDFHNFDYLGDKCLLSTSQELISLLSLEPDIEWSIGGYQLKLKGAGSIYLRLDLRPDLIILDLMNPSIDNMNIIINILNRTGSEWWFQQMPSLVIGHSFFIFFAANNIEAINKVVKKEFPLIINLIHLSAIYGGK